MELDKETQQKNHDLQHKEQTVQSMLMQKQAFQIELNETENALSEISKSNEIFKMVGQIIVKADKERTKKDLEKKKELLSLRLKSIEKQETEMMKDLEELKEEVMKKIK